MSHGRLRIVNDFAVSLQSLLKTCQSGSKLVGATFSWNCTMGNTSAVSATGPSNSPHKWLIGRTNELVQPAGTPRTVVIATADDDIGERFSAALQGAGHRTIGVRGADELVRQLGEAAGAVDLLLLDLRVDTTERQAVRALRRAAPGVPVVVFSGSVQTAAEVRALAELGIHSYVNEHSAAEHVLPSLSPELFPDSFNRRTSMRVILDIPVVYRFGETIATAPTLNLSKGGLGIRTLTPVDTGTKVRVTFRLPGREQDLEASARVAWSDQRTGMGLQFEEMPTLDQSAVDEFVDRHVRGQDGRV